MNSVKRDHVKMALEPGIRIRKSESEIPGFPTPLPTQAIRIGTKQGHEWTDVGDQAPECCVAAAALFG